MKPSRRISTLVPVVTNSPSPWCVWCACGVFVNVCVCVCVCVCMYVSCTLPIHTVALRVRLFATFQYVMCQRIVSMCTSLSSGRYFGWRRNCSVPVVHIDHSCDLWSRWLWRAGRRGGTCSCSLISAPLAQQAWKFCWRTNAGPVNWITFSPATVPSGAAQ